LREGILGLGNAAGKDKDKEEERRNFQGVKKGQVFREGI
jgi:hypothetical protein